MFVIISKVDGERVKSNVAKTKDSAIAHFNHETESLIALNGEPDSFCKKSRDIHSLNAQWENGSFVDVHYHLVTL